MSKEKGKYCIILYYQVPGRLDSRHVFDCKAQTLYLDAPLGSASSGLVVVSDKLSLMVTRWLVVPPKAVSFQVNIQQKESCPRVFSKGPENRRLRHVPTPSLVTVCAWSLRVETSSFQAQVLVQVWSWTSRISITCKFVRNADS